MKAQKRNNLTFGFIQYCPKTQATPPSRVVISKISTVVLFSAISLLSVLYRNLIFLTLLYKEIKHLLYLILGPDSAQEDTMGQLKISIEFDHNVFLNKRTENRASLDVKLCQFSRGQKCLQSVFGFDSIAISFSELIDTVGGIKGRVRGMGNVQS